MHKHLLAAGLFALAGAIVFNTLHQPAQAQSGGAAAKCQVVTGGVSMKRTIASDLPQVIDSHKQRGAAHVQVQTFGDLGLFVCSY